MKHPAFVHAKHWAFRLRPDCFISLPDEILILIFEGILVRYDTAALYQDLIALQLVCKQWRRVAGPMLYSRVEVGNSDHCLALEQTLSSAQRSGSPIPIDTLAVGLSNIWTGFVTTDQMDRLLQLAPGVRKLIILYTQSTQSSDPVPPEGKIERINTLPTLSSLIDVTIHTPALFINTHAASALISCLGPQVRFLQLPGIQLTDSIAEPLPMSLGLYGLTVDEYPSFLTNWILPPLKTSLQMFTVGALRYPTWLAHSHPNIRSLRVLHQGTLPAGETLSHFHRLQHLELRAPTVELAVLETLPPSLEYFRFWSTDIARLLNDMLSHPPTRARCSQLRTLVWDWWTTIGAPDDRMEEMTLQQLHAVCAREHIELHAYQRLDCFHPSEGNDTELEASMREACFNIDQDTPHHHHSSLRCSSTPTPTRVLGAMIQNKVPLASSLTHACVVHHSVRDTYEDVFEGSAEWVAVYHSEMRKRGKADDDAKLALDRQRQAERRQVQGRDIIRASVQILYALPVFIGALCLIFCVFPKNLNRQLGIGWFASAGLITASLPRVTLPGPRPDDLIYMVYAKIVMLLFALTISVYVSTHLRHADNIGGCIFAGVLPAIAAVIILARYVFKILRHENPLVDE